jgi:hypothetical protein
MIPIFGGKMENGVFLANQLLPIFAGFLTKKPNLTVHIFKKCHF